jgi:hypothetical protein
MPVNANVEPRTLLVALLREHLRLTGTYVGLDTSQCSCTLRFFLPCCHPAGIFALSYPERSTNVVRVSINQGEQNACRHLRDSAALLPVPHCRQTEPERKRKLPLRKGQLLSDSPDIHLAYNWDLAFTYIGRLASGMRQGLRKTVDDFTTGHGTLSALTLFG